MCHNGVLFLTFIILLIMTNQCYRGVLLCYYLRIENAEGYVLIAVYLFICMRVTRITQKVLNRIT